MKRRTIPKLYAGLTAGIMIGAALPAFGEDNVSPNDYDTQIQAEEAASDEVVPPEEELPFTGGTEGLHSVDGSKILYTIAPIPRTPRYNLPHPAAEPLDITMEPMPLYGPPPEPVVSPSRGFHSFAEFWEWLLGE